MGLEADSDDGGVLFKFAPEKEKSFVFGLVRLSVELDDDGDDGEDGEGGSCRQVVGETMKTCSSSENQASSEEG